jgi:hypothetical protein
MLSKKIKKFLFWELLRSLSQVVGWCTLAAFFLVNFVLFVAFETYEWQPGHLKMVSEFKRELGCNENPIIFCLQEYASESPENLRDLEEGFRTGLSGIYKFPFNFWGTVYFGGIAFLIVIVGVFVTHNQKSKHSKSHASLVAQFPRVQGFVNVVQQLIDYPLVLVSSHLGRVPVTIYRTIILPVSSYQEYRAQDCQIEPSHLHALLHEKAHASVLFPFEQIFKSLHTSCVVFFFAILFPFGIGMIFGPIAYISLLFSSSRRDGITEELANLVADHFAQVNDRHSRRLLLKYFWQLEIFEFCTALFCSLFLWLSSNHSVTGVARSIGLIFLLIHAAFQVATIVSFYSIVGRKEKDWNMGVI